MKLIAAAALAVLLAWPVAAFEKHELKLKGGKYNEQTGLTAYEVEDGICFTSEADHRESAESRGLAPISIVPLAPGKVLLVLANEDDTYREVYLIDQIARVGCLKAVGYAEGSPA